MSNIEVLKELKDRGLLSGLIKSGVLPVKIMYHIDIYYYVDAQRQSGVGKKKSVELASEAFKVCTATVYNAINSLKQLA